jgi:hypothetical protein
MVSEIGDGGEYNGGQGRLSEGKQSSAVHGWRWLFWAKSPRWTCRSSTL